MNNASSIRRIAQFLAVALLTACGSGGGSKYPAGYSDGFAEGVQHNLQDQSNSRRG